MMDPESNQRRLDPRQADKPLLPAWASGAAVEHEANNIVNEINNMFGAVRYAEGRAAREAKAIEARGTREAPQLIRETEAFLRHEAEGWLSWHFTSPSQTTIHNYSAKRK